MRRKTFGTHSESLSFCNQGVGMNNFEVIQKELEWLEKVIKIRLEFPKIDIFNKEALALAMEKTTTVFMRKEEYELAPPEYEEASGSYSTIINGMETGERLMLILALSNHIESGFINKIVERGNYSEVFKTNNFAIAAGYTGQGSYGYYPTGRFWLFLIAGTGSSLKMEWMKKILQGEIRILSSGLVCISNTEDYEPFFGGMFQISPKNLLALLH